MKHYDTGELRNLAVVGHGAAGKTTLVEAMLALGKEINRMGTIETGTTVSDYHPGEKERQISIHSTPLHVEWDQKKFNIIDAPGYSDFIGESISSLAVVDMAVVLIHAVNGIEVGTESMWNNATELGIPKVLVINGLDRENTKFDNILNEAKERFGKNVFPMQLPVNAGPNFNRIIDVLRRELITYKNDGSGGYSEEGLPENLVSDVDSLHAELIEYVAESDDSLLEKYFEQGNLSEEEMRSGIHHAIQNQVFIPMFCISAEKNIGVARLCDFIAKYGASPDDRKIVKAINSKEDEIDVSLDGKDTVIQIFKTMAESHIGELSLFRVYSGTVKTGDDLYNTNRNSSERMGQLFILNGKNRTQIDRLSAGDIGAVVKLKDKSSDSFLM